MNEKDRARERRRRTIVTNRTTSFAEAEEWDLDFWQSVGPEERLSALVTIRRDVERVTESRAKADRRGE